MEIILSKPRGFCAGVIRAIEIVERALEAYGPPIYVLHEIVHNGHVVQELRARGAVFVESLDEVPAGAIVIFSAHGVGNVIVHKAHERELRVIDAACPLVAKVHLQMRRYHRRGKELIIVGHVGHPEVDGHRGQVEGRVHVISTPQEVRSLDVGDPDNVAYVTQTTLSIDDTRDVIHALKERFPCIEGPDLDDICYATQNRQNAVFELSHRVDVLLVVGAKNSSNSNRLKEVGQQNDLASYLIESADMVDPVWFSPDTRVGITAGASAPEFLVQQVVERLKAIGVTSVTEMDGEHEDAVFALPDVTQFESVPGG